MLYYISLPIVFKNKNKKDKQNFHALLNQTKMRLQPFCLPSLTKSQIWNILLERINILCQTCIKILS